MCAGRGACAEDADWWLQRVWIPPHAVLRSGYRGASAVVRTCTCFHRVRCASRGARMRMLLDVCLEGGRIGCRRVQWGCSASITWQQRPSRQPCILTLRTGRGGGVQAEGVHARAAKGAAVRVVECGVCDRRRAGLRGGGAYKAPHVRSLPDLGGLPTGAGF